MFKLQDILLKEPYFDVSKELYYRSDDCLEIAADNSVKLLQSAEYDFFTFFNSLSVKKYIDYTYAESFYLVLEAKGEFKVNVFGYLGKEDRFQKERLGTYAFNCVKKEKLIIPVKPIFAEHISFAIICDDDTFLYNAYYAADLETDSIDHPFVHVIATPSDDKSKAKKKKSFLYDYISALKEFDKKFYYDDTEGVSDAFPEFKSIKSPKKTTHFLNIADNYVSESTLERLYVFLQLLKPEFRDMSIVGTITDIKTPGLRYELDKDTVKNTVETICLSSFDLLPVSGVVENESFCEDALVEASDIGGFICVSKSVYDKKSIQENPCIRINGLCAYGKSVKEKIKKTYNNDKNRLYKLYDLMFQCDKTIEITKFMYYRSDAHIIKNDEGFVQLPGGNRYDFFTYFNSFSIEKWKKYTSINDLFLVIEAKGSFNIDLFGHYKNKTGYQKELFGNHVYNLEDYEEIVLRYPGGVQSSLVGFFIDTFSDVVIKNAYYATDIDEAKLKSPLISMVTTTYKKEDYVKKNIELLSGELLNDENYKDYFIWNIIDNGRTLELEEGLSPSIRLFQNKNVGGAGGFAKGMMVSLTQKEKSDYILLMDDDVVFVPESFKRLYTLLSTLKDDYKDYFISGAMLKMGQPNVQHEDTGKLIAEGYHVAIKPNYDLNLWNHIIDNEVIDDTADHQYGAWWFCCIPTTVANLDNLPVPVFVRGDDVEYSLRNKAKFITMNGLCIWHEGFEGKFSAALEFYQVNRNELAVRAMHSELKDVDCIGHIKTIFWEEIYKFNYRGASLLLDAVEDYMKGPEFFRTLDGEKSLKNKRKKDNKMIPITPEIAAQIDYETLYENVPVTGKMKMIYDYSYNGQARLPELFIKNKTGVIPYGWGYSPGKMCLTKQNIAVDQTNQTYVVYKKSRKRFEQLKERYSRVMGKYDREHKKIEKDYQNSFVFLTGQDFWNEYLHIDN